MKKLAFAVLVLFATVSFAQPSGSKPLHKFSVGHALKSAPKAVLFKAPLAVGKATVTTLDTLKQSVGVGVETIGSGVQIIGKAFEKIQPLEYVLGVPLDNAGYYVTEAGGWVALH